MKTGITVSEAMTERPIFLASDNDVKLCAQIMDENRVGAIIVKDDDHPIGILTEKDIQIKEEIEKI